MPEAASKKAKTQSLYDRMADVQNLAMKLNGYKNSLAKYLGSLNLPLTKSSVVLDAGSGTGIVSMAFARSGLAAGPRIALDLSIKSLAVAREEFDKTRATKKIRIAQGNILHLPFADETFDLVLTCGVLEYVALGDGLAELARALNKGGHLVLVPVKPSIVGSVLEIIYDFKIHPIAEIRKVATKHFTIVKTDEFPPTNPISWSKNVLLLRKN